MIVYVGIPMYGGAHGLTVSCLLASQKHLMEKGHTVTFDIVAGGSILPKVRNGIVKRFIDSAAQVLVFIDADMVWEPDTLAKLVDAPFDVSVANYRKRSNEVAWLAQSLMVGKMHEGEEWHQTKRAGTGLMSIPRRTIENMVQKYPELAYEEDGEQVPCLFDFELAGGRYHGEDYTFCRRLEELGGEIYILANAYVGHVGTTVYGGNYREYLNG